MSTWKTTIKSFALIAGVFLAFFFLPVDNERFRGGVMESLYLAKWYAREHVLLCLVPAFFIAGAIGVFVSQASVMKYLGAKANKILAYGVASVSGSILAVCSCTVLPLFAGIWRMGAGLGPACAFLYSGPAINVLAIILTARVLGLELGIARAVGAISFSVIIGLAMHLIYRKEELAKANGQLAMPEPDVSRPLWKNSLFFAAMVGVLVFANWAKPADVIVTVTDRYHDAITYHGVIEHLDPDSIHLRGYMQANASRQPPTLFVIPRNNALIMSGEGVWWMMYRMKWIITAGFAIALAGMISAWFRRDELGQWVGSTWEFAKQILPLLLAGVLAAGFLLGRPGYSGVIPNEYIEALVGDSPDRMLALTGWGGGGFESFARSIWPLWTNFFASVFGAFMYFATLTEVPILQGLIGAGMGKGPALALLLAGPALSLPSMLVIRSIMGTQKTVVFCSLVVVMATISGMIFGAWF